MLLTGFDSPRLKKLYIGRVIKAHNLLQTLTRVNRTYKDFRYGYVVDFAGIEAQFKKTSQDYFNELQNELGDEIESYSNLFLTEEEIKNRLMKLKTCFSILIQIMQKTFQDKSLIFQIVRKCLRKLLKH